MIGRPRAMLGDTVQGIEDAFQARYAMSDPPAEVLIVDGTIDLKEDPAGDRTIELALGPMQESTAYNGSPAMPVEQILEIVLKQNFDLADPNDVGKEAAAADRRTKRKEFLNWVGDVVGFCRFLSVAGMNEHSAVRYVQGGPIELDGEEAKELQWYIELAVPLSLEAMNSPPRARLSFGTYTGPSPASSITFRYSEGGDALPGETQVVTA